jgi:hypothetical protein
VNRHFVRAVLSILVVRAIFISPAQGSEFGPASQPTRSSLKRIELIRPTRLRFTKPYVPSASQERFDCCDGGDGDERSRPVETSVEAWPFAAASRPPAYRPDASPGSSCQLVRLRC